MDSLIPASKISNLTQGMFARAVADNEKVKQEVRQIVKDEITWIKNAPELCHLIKEEE